MQNGSTTPWPHNHALHPCLAAARPAAKPYHRPLGRRAPTTINPRNRGSPYLGPSTWPRRALAADLRPLESSNWELGLLSCS